MSEPTIDNPLTASSKEKMPEKVPPLPAGVIFHAEWSPQYKQAREFLYGDDVTPRNFSAAYSLLQQEAESGSALAMNDLGRMNADGLGREIDPQAADAWYQRALVAFLAAEKAKPRPYLQYRIGKLYAAGLGTPQDYATAAKWFGEAVEKDHRYAQYSLGGLYYRGQGVIQDYKQAFILYSSSADQGNPYAAYELAKMYRDGIGTPVNEVKANQYFKAAFRGFDSLEKEGHDDKLQYRIGQMLYTGTGTVKNIPLAVEYLQKSAQMGNVNAQYLLGKICLEKGIGDPTQAIEWIMKAAKAENAGAQYALAKLYQDGKYLPKLMLLQESYKEKSVVEKIEVDQKQTDDLHDIRSAVQKMQRELKADPDKLLNYLAFSAKFYQYSPRNLMMIYAQNPHATFTAAKGRYLRMGYRVKPGEKGIEILRPQTKEYFERNGYLVPVMKATNAEKAKLAAGKIEVVQKTYFDPSDVYDISQTTCPVKDYPKVYDKGYNSEQHAALFERMKELSELSGVPVEIKDLASISLNGFYSPQQNTITLNHLLQDSERLDTMCHEYAHALLHRTTTQSPAVAEFEAQCLANMLESRFGLPTSENNKEYMVKNLEEAQKDPKFKLDVSLARVQKQLRYIDKRIDIPQQEEELELEPQQPKHSNKAPEPGFQPSHRGGGRT